MPNGGILKKICAGRSKAGFIYNSRKQGGQRENKGEAVGGDDNWKRRVDIVELP